MQEINILGTRLWGNMFPSSQGLWLISILCEFLLGDSHWCEKLKGQKEIILHTPFFFFLRQFPIQIWVIFCLVFSKTKNNFITSLLSTSRIFLNRSKPKVFVTYWKFLMWYLKAKVIKQVHIRKIDILLQLGKDAVFSRRAADSSRPLGHIWFQKMPHIISQNH